MMMMGTQAQAMITFSPPEELPGCPSEVDRVYHDRGLKEELLRVIFCSPVTKFDGWRSYSNKLLSFFLVVPLKQEVAVPDGTKDGMSESKGDSKPGADDEGKDLEVEVEKLRKPVLYVDRSGGARDLRFFTALQELVLQVSKVNVPINAIS